jgi:hypothetical protein
MIIADARAPASRFGRVVVAGVSAELGRFCLQAACCFLDLTGVVFFVVVLVVLGDFLTMGAFISEFSFVEATDRAMDRFRLPEFVDALSLLSVCSLFFGLAACLYELLE